MRINILSLLLIMVPITISAQDYEGLRQFVDSYNCSILEHQEMVGQPVPDFVFNQNVTNKTLKGSFYILPYWASWCMPCRQLIKDIDSLLVRDSEFDRTVKVIAVNSGEKSEDRAKTFWKQNDIQFPTYAGEGVEDFAKRSYGGHPSCLLVDDKGIVRMRLDGYLNTQAEFLRLGIHILKTDPEKHPDYTLEDIRGMMEKGQYPLALYLLEKRADDIVKAVTLRYQCMMALNSWKAKLYFDQKKTELAGSSGYTDFMKSVAKTVYQQDSRFTVPFVVQMGCEACDLYIHQLFLEKRDAEPEMKGLKAVLDHRYGECLVSMAKSAAASLNSDEMKQVSPQLAKDLETIINSKRE